MAKKLTDIDNLGDRTKTKLNNVGIADIDDLANIDPSEVADKVSKISEDRLRQYKNEAQRSSIQIMSGDEVKEEYDNLTKISTGIELLDNVLGGGLESGFLVSLAGPTGSGKTQLTFQTLGQAVKDTGKKAVYIETERGRYRGNRIIEMFDEDVQKHVHKIEAYNLDQQEMAYEKVKEAFGPNELACVAVDSFTARFRMSDSFQGRSDLPDRHTVMSRHLNKLDELAAVCDVPIILTCQVSANPDQYGGTYTVYGGTLMHHMVNFVGMMKSGQGALTNIELRNHPNVENREVGLQITENGIHEPS